jgi:porphobilinogen deaminase
MLAAIHDGPTGQRLAAERAYLAALDGSCETPIAGLALLDGAAGWLGGDRGRGARADCRWRGARARDRGQDAGAGAGGFLLLGGRLREASDRGSAPDPGILGKQ